MTDLANLSATKNHFELFSLPIRFDLDRPLLEQRYLELSRLAHPDFAGDNPESQMQSLETSARVNEAYAVLIDHLRRAEYLLELTGGSAGEVKLSPEALERIFELREALSLAQSSQDDQGAKEVRQHAHDWFAQIMANAGRRLNNGETGSEVRQLLAQARYVRKIATS